MINDLIDDMNKALDNNCFLSALSLALTLPDICGKAKFPSERSTKKRYITWYDEYVGKYEQCPEYEGTMPYLSGEVVYNLRCNFLHQGNPNLEKEKITEDCCKIDQFILETENKKEFNILMDSSSSSESYCGNKKIGETHRTYTVNVRRLCFIISANAKAYYNDNKELFDFFNFSIIDKDKESKLREI